MDFDDEESPVLSALKWSLLASSQVARTLCAKGVTDAQMKGADFARAPDGSPVAWEDADVEQWPAIKGAGWPERMRRELLVWCALRWVTIDEPMRPFPRSDAENIVKMFLKDELASKAVAEVDRAQKQRSEAGRAKKVPGPQNKLKSAVTDVVRDLRINFNQPVKTILHEWASDADRAERGIFCESIGGASSSYRFERDGISVDLSLNTLQARVSRKP